MENFWANIAAVSARFVLRSPTNLSASGTNLLAVRVDNTKFPDIAPLSGDFSVYGGLYRPVHLIVTGDGKFHADGPRFAGRRVAADERHRNAGGAGRDGANFQRHENKSNRRR